MVINAGIKTKPPINDHDQTFLSLDLAFKPKTTTTNINTNFFVTNFLRIMRFIAITDYIKYIQKSQQPLFVG